MHHAYLYEGGLSLLPLLAEHAKKESAMVKDGDPDVHTLTYEKFGIEDARELRTSASLKSAKGHALYIIGAGTMTSESQHALLKLFEEPQEGAVFILLVPKGSVIPTLKSRFLEYPEKVTGVATPTEAKKFLGCEPKARSAEIAKILKEEDGVRERVRDFLNSLEEFLYNSFWTGDDKNEIRDGLEDIARIRSYVNDRSPSLKMLLEHLAVTLPILK